MTKEQILAEMKSKNMGKTKNMTDIKNKYGSTTMKNKEKKKIAS
jgi:ribosomal protein S21